MKIPKTYYPKRFWYRKPKRRKPQPMSDKGGESSMAKLDFKTLVVMVEDGKEREFIEHLEALLKLYAVNRAYHYRYNTESL